MMGFAGAILGWSPAEYYASTPHEYWAAYEVWREANTTSDDPTGVK
jgi:hypothetical protein